MYDKIVSKLLINNYPVKLIIAESSKKITIIRSMNRFIKKKKMKRRGFEHPTPQTKQITRHEQCHTATDTVTFANTIFRFIILALYFKTDRSVYNEYEWILFITIKNRRYIVLKCIYFYFALFCKIKKKIFARWSSGAHIICAIIVRLQHKLCHKWDSNHRTLRHLMILKQARSPLDHRDFDKWYDY